MPSTPQTAWPASVRRLATWKPMKHAVPVMKNRTALRLHHVGRRDAGAGAGVARIDHELRSLRDRRIVNPIMVGDNQHGVVAFDSGVAARDTFAAGHLGMLTRARNLRHMRVVEIGFGAALLDELDQ